MKYLALIALLVATSAYATEEETYCDYATQKAEADRILLVAPSALASLGRNPSTLTTVEIVGATESLSHYLKGKLQKDIGQGDCEVYRSMSDLAKHATYDGVVIRNSVVARKSEAIEEAIKQVEELVASEKQRVAVGTSTIVTIELLETARAKLYGDLFELQSQNNPIAVPTLSNHPIDELIVHTNSLLADEQHLLAKSAKYDNWDVSLGVGGASEVLNGTRTVQPYATVTMSYQFGSAARNRALDKSGEAYAKLLNEQGTGPVQLAYLLKRKVEEMVRFNSKALQAAIDYNAAIINNAKTLEGIETNDAHKFRVQLTLDQINNTIQIHTLQQSNSILTKYLAINFNHE